MTLWQKQVLGLRFVIVIAHQHAMHAERDSVLENPCIYSIHPVPVLCQNEWTYCNTFLTF